MYPVLTLLLGLAPLAGAAALQNTQGALEEPDGPARSFSIPAAHTARALYQRIEGHVAAERWSDAISDLQTMLEEHRGYVLGSRREDRNGQRSQYPLHPGATEEARERLLTLPREALELYADRYGPLADEALERGRRTLDRATLVEVARRWPATEAGPRAWFSLGDLELELGNVEAACGAWRRGAEITERLGRELSEGARTRLELCGGLDSGESTEMDDGALSLRALAKPPAQLSLPGPNDTRGNVPTADCDSWTRAIDDGPHPGPFHGSQSADNYNLFPVLYEDVVLVSTSMRLMAFDAFSGALLWRTPEPPGWPDVTERPTIADDGTRVERLDFFEGVNRTSAMIAPAAAGGIAVAALQIPVTKLGNTAFQRTIDITKVIPDRRLFAFDVHTGRELWNHMPPPVWDGESGTFAQRMRVAGPPVIAGTRVLVPMYRPQGRIDYHVACFDLVSGRTLWSRAIISGQVPLNMFGRPEEEYAAPPLRVEGERVIALTQLGAIAALDVYTGDILWESLYEQIALPGAEGFSASTRMRVWKNAAPVVAEGVVVATPTDSRDLIGLDLVTGAVRWTYPQRRIVEGTEHHYNRGHELALIGASDDSVYLAGRRVYDVRALNDYRGGPLQFFRSAELQMMSSRLLPRPALGARHVVVPADARRVSLDLFDLRLEDPQYTGDWGSAGKVARGNCLVANGALFTLSGKYLTALFDWKEAEERLTRDFEKDPFDYRAATQLGNFLARRATVEWESQRYRSALDYVVDARGVLEPLLARSADSAAAEEGGLQARLHEVYMLEARILLDDLQPERALANLERASELAPDDERLMDALLEMAALLDGRDRERWFETLATLERECGHLALADDGRAQRDSELSAEAIASKRRRIGAQRDEVQQAPPMRVAQWVLFERARAYSLAGEVEPELQALHTLLSRYGDVELPANENDLVEELVSTRIGRRIDEFGREIYEPFEQRARALLDDARRIGEQGAFERVTLLYPFSLASDEARGERLAAALAAGDIATVAEITFASLSNVWTVPRSSTEETRRLVQLARALEENGNTRYARNLLERLARYHGRERATNAEQAPTLTKLARAFPALEPVPFPGELSDFGVPTRSGSPSATENASLGPLDPSDCEPGEVRWAFVLPEQIVVFSSLDIDSDVWSFPIDVRSPAYFEQQHSLIRPGRLVIVDDRHDAEVLIGIDAKTGREAWRWSTPYKVQALFEDSGVVVAILNQSQDFHAVALDTHSGVELWQLALSKEVHQTTPIFGEGRMVLMPRSSQDPRARVFELATGTPGLPVELGATPPSDDRFGAWIENNSLVVPHFARAGRGDDNWAVGYDLDTGLERWTVRGDGLRELRSIAKSGTDTYLILNGTGSGRGASGQILQLDTRLGSQRPVSDTFLSIDDDPIGLLPRRVTQLGSPYLFLRSVSPATNQVLIRAIHLPYGERWTHTLPVPEDELYTSSMPLPALSKKTVAIVYSKRGNNSESHLLLLDRTRGTRRELQILDRRFDANRTMRLVPIGRWLVLSGRKLISIIEGEEQR